MPAKREINFRGMTGVLAQRTAAVHAAHLVPHLKPHFRILDIGSGPGSITLDLARLVPEGSVVGLDINSGMTAFHQRYSPFGPPYLLSIYVDFIHSSRLAAEQQRLANVEFIQGDAQDLRRFESESFDVVHAHQLLLHLPRALDAMKEMRRLTKRGGMVSSRDNAFRTWIPLNPALEKGIEGFDRHCEARGVDSFFGRRSHIVAHEVGFGWDEIETGSVGWEFSGPEGRAAWVQGAAGSASKSMLETGVLTEEETEEYRLAWEEWKERPEARMMAVDGTLLCWK